MQITEVRMRIVDEVESEDRLKAFVNITFDNGFSVRDLKIIGGDRGLFIAMPARKLTDRCPKCHEKNPLLAKFCSECGTQLASPQSRSRQDDDGKYKWHADIAHPIDQNYRAYMQTVLLNVFFAGIRQRFERFVAVLIDDEIVSVSQLDLDMQEPVAAFSLYRGEQ